MNLAHLQETRATKIAEMRALGDNPDATKFDALEAEVKELDGQIRRAESLAALERSAPAIVSRDNVGDGQYEDRAAEFSITRAIAAACGDDVDDGKEREISAEVRRRTGRKFVGIAVPDEAFLEKRTLTTSGDAASLYPTQHRPDLFIDRLRSSLVVGRLGATVLDNLVGDQEIPRQIASSTAQHVAEDGSLTETDADFDDVTLAPKTVGAITSFSRRTLINAVPSIEQLVRRDLASVIANAIDFQALMGDGLSNNPTGVANTAGVYAASLATPSWAEVLDFIAGIQNEDADLGNLGWAMNPSAVAKLRGTSKVASTDSVMLMENPGNLAGYAVGSTTAIPNVVATGTTTSVIYGAWSQLLVGYWSATDLLVNPYETSAYARGRVLVRAMRDYDVAVRHAESFAVADDLVIA